MTEETILEAIADVHQAVLESRAPRWAPNTRQRLALAAGAILLALAMLFPPFVGTTPKLRNVGQHFAFLFSGNPESPYVIDARLLTIELAAILAITLLAVLALSRR